jgi:type IV secretion system protein TrbL
MLRSAIAPMQDAYREGASAGYRATSGSSDDSGASGSGLTAAGGPPGWARDMARRQRLTQAGMITAQALREGDRPAGSSGPSLKSDS